MKKKSYKCPSCGVVAKPHAWDIQEKKDVCEALDIILNMYTASIGCECPFKEGMVEVMEGMVTEAKRYLDEKLLLIVASQKAHVSMLKAVDKRTKESFKKLRKEQTKKEAKNGR